MKTPYPVAAFMVSCSLLCLAACGDDDDIPTPGATTQATVWLLDNADSPSLRDTLTILDESGRAVAAVSGLNFSQTIGGHRAVAVSPNGDYALVSDGTSRLRRYDASGQVAWTLNRSITSVALAPNGKAYALVDTGTIYGGGILRLDTTSGNVLDENGPGGFDLAVDDGGGAVWLVGADVKRLTLDLQVQFAIDPVAWAAVSVDVAADGSAWLVERQHPDVPGSQARLLQVSSNGAVLRAVPLSADPYCVRVNRRDGTVWVATNQGVYKFDNAGAPLARISESAAWTVAINEHDASVWVATTSDATLVHYAHDGTKLREVTGFSADQKYVALP